MPGLPRKENHKTQKERNGRMVALYRMGVGYIMLGRIFKISTGRACQIVKRELNREPK